MLQHTAEVNLRVNVHQSSHKEKTKCNGSGRRLQPGKLRRGCENWWLWSGSHVVLNVSQTWAALVKATGFYIKGCFALVNSPGDFSFF